MAMSKASNYLWKPQLILHWRLAALATSLINRHSDGRCSSHGRMQQSILSIRCVSSVLQNILETSKIKVERQKEYVNFRIIT